MKFSKIMVYLVPCNIHGCICIANSSFGLHMIFSSCRIYYLRIALQIIWNIVKINLERSLQQNAMLQAWFDNIFHKYLEMNIQGMRNPAMQCCRLVFDNKGITGLFIEYWIIIINDWIYEVIHAIFQVSTGITCFWPVTSE